MEEKLRKIGERARLSRKEKEFHRAELLRFMERKTIPSPFSFVLFIGHHLPATALVIFFALAATVSLGAEGSLPGSIIYPIKTKVNEPVMYFLTLDKKARADLKVHLVEKRLEEISQVTEKNVILAPEEEDAMIDHLSDQVGEAQEAISDLVEKEDFSGALQAANELHETLKTEDEKLEKQDLSATTAIQKGELALEIDESIESTTLIENDIEKKMKKKPRKRQTFLFKLFLIFYLRQIILAGGDFLFAF